MSRQSQPQRHEQQAAKNGLDELVGAHPDALRHLFLAGVATSRGERHSHIDAAGLGRSFDGSTATENDEVSHRGVGSSLDSFECAEHSTKVGWVVGFPIVLW